MFTILGFLAVLVSLLLILAVVIQNSKGGGLSSTFGGSNSASQLFGARRSNEAIEKITWYLAGGLAIIAFMANTIGISLSSGSDSTLRMEEAFEEGIQYNANPGNIIDPNATQPEPILPPEENMEEE